MEVVPKGSNFIEKKKKIAPLNACETPLLYVLSPPPAVGERATAELPERGRSHG